MAKVTNWDDIVNDEAVAAAKKRRSVGFVEEKFHSLLREQKESEGWSFIKTVERGLSVRMRKQKDVGTAFEDQVWMMFYRMGFRILNATDKFTMYNVADDRVHQQIDIFAVDEENIFIVECKARESFGPHTYKKEIEALIGHMEWISNDARAKFPGRKVKFIWATHNVERSQADKDRLDNAGIKYIDDAAITYYNDLSAHLGKAAKYQFFSRTFAKEEIRNFENRVYAIQSKIKVKGEDKSCYSFSIEPERLLKLGYILHHHSANEDMMPAYQRLIKKSRLKKIRDFVEKCDGYFANSLIVSIDTEGAKLRFDKIHNGLKSDMVSVGILHLPPKYCSAYIIDGQHRLYAYSDSTLANKHTVPVVAFENLDKTEQLKLFMDINENQKSVPKSLRATLNWDMLWNSEDPELQRVAIASKIAQKLEDDPHSKLRGRIIIGENEQSQNRRVTINAIQEALKKSGLFNKYTRSKGSSLISEVGLLDYDDSTRTYDSIFSLLMACFAKISETSPEAWDYCDDDYTLVVTNRGIQAIIRIVGDVLRYLKSIGGITDPKVLSAEDLKAKVVPYLEPLCLYFNSVDVQSRKELRKHLGAKADTIFLHEFQKAIHSRYAGFNPEGLEEHMRDSSKQFNDETKENIKTIREAVLAIFEDVLWDDMASEEYVIRSFPKSAYNRITNEIGNYEYEHQGQTIDFKKLVTFKELFDYADRADFWNLIGERLTDPSIRRTASRRSKMQWLEVLDDVSKKLANNSSYSVPEDLANKVADIREWIVVNE